MSESLCLVFIYKTRVKDFAIDKNNRIIGKVDNIDANRHEAIRAKIIRDIKKEEKKRKQEDKRLRIEKIKDQGKSTCILLKARLI